MNHPTFSTLRARATRAWKRFHPATEHAVSNLDIPRSVTTAEPSIGLTCVLDPEDTGTLIGVRGVLTAGAVAELHAETEGLRPGSLAHLDLTDTTIPVGPLMGMLEALADSLEARHVRVRIVGIDPDHPALRSPQRRLDETL
jgi:hypothetical protein